MIDDRGLMGEDLDELGTLLRGLEALEVSMQGSRAGEILPHITRLRRLEIWWDDIRWDEEFNGLAELVDGPVFDSIESFTFHSALGLAGARSLAQRRRPGKLRHLDLGFSALSDDGAKVSPLRRGQRSLPDFRWTPMMPVSKRLRARHISGRFANSGSEAARSPSPASARCSGRLT